MFTLPELPYKLNSLEPYISEKNLDIHYNKHHKNYVDNINKLIKNTEYENMNLQQIIINAFGSIYNNAAQNWNHTFYWRSLSPNGGDPIDPIATAIDNQWNGYDNFKQELISRGKKFFGSGWLWFVYNTHNSELALVETNNAGSLCPQNDNKYIPLFVIDLWEHSYYLTYYNEKGTYLENIWKIINWDFVNKNYEVAKE